MKKSLAMLFAMFMLGACSVTPNADWKALVGGKTVYNSYGEVGKFSSDAGVITIQGYDLDLKDSTANSAEYSGKMGSPTVTYKFSEVDENGGKCIDPNGGEYDFTWTKQATD